MDCTFMRITDVLKAFYVVPDFQRDYVWKEDNVVTLLGDIKTSLDSLEPGDTSDDDIYFIGSMVVFAHGSKANSKFLLIDGQQRMTTLFLLFCAIKNRQIEKGLNVPSWLTGMLHSAEPGPDGQDEVTYRLELNYKRNQELLEGAFNGKLLNEPKSALQKSQQNIIDAYDYIYCYLKDNDDIDSDLLVFATRIRSHVGLVRIEADDLQKAMIVFDTLNYRGVELDGFDLLKNMLYTKAENENKTQRLTQHWDEIKENLSYRGVKPMRFLRYFIVSIDKSLLGRPPTEKKAFGWFQNANNRSKHNINSDPVRFAERLSTASSYYKRLLFDSIDHNGQHSTALDSLNSIVGSSGRQHMGLMLTAINKNCPSNLFEIIVRCVESVLFYSFSTKLRSQELETLLAHWTNKLQNIDVLNQECVHEFVQGIKRDMEDIVDRFYQGFENFGQDVVSQKYRQKYILAKYLKFGEPKKPDLFISHIMKNKELEIEHVYPRNPSSDARREFQISGNPKPESEEEMKCIGLLANLLLMEGFQNKAVSNKAYSKKKGHYADSNFWMVKKFANATPNTTASMTHSLQKWPTHASWNFEELKRRQMEYAKIARKIWNFGL